MYSKRDLKTSNNIKQDLSAKRHSISAVAVAGEIGNNSFDHNLGNWADMIGIFFYYDEKTHTIILADRGQGVLVT